MSQTARVLIFIGSILVLIFLNAALMIYENKAGMRLSRWLTFVAPLTVLYFIIFKSGRNENAAEPTSDGALVLEMKQPEESESDILDRELHDPEIEWQEINEWPSSPEEPAVIDVGSQVQPASSQIEQLERLSKLRKEGGLTDDEFNALKARLLGQSE